MMLSLTLAALMSLGSLGLCGLAANFIYGDITPPSVWIGLWTETAAGWGGFVILLREMLG